MPEHSSKYEMSEQRDLTEPTREARELIAELRRASTDEARQRAESHLVACANPFITATARRFFSAWPDHRGQGAFHDARAAAQLDVLKGLSDLGDPQDLRTLEGFVARTTMWRCIDVNTSYGRYNKNMVTQRADEKADEDTWLSEQAAKHGETSPSSDDLVEQSMEEQRAVDAILTAEERRDELRGRLVRALEAVTENKRLRRGPEYARTFRHFYLDGGALNELAQRLGVGANRVEKWRERGAASVERAFLDDGGTPDDWAVVQRLLSRGLLRAEAR